VEHVQGEGPVWIDVLPFEGRQARRSMAVSHPLSPESRCNWYGVSLADDLCSAVKSLGWREGSRS